MTDTMLITCAPGNIGGKLSQLLHDSGAGFRVMC
jgi:hypothetical protein